MKGIFISSGSALTDSGESEGLAGDLRYCISNATDGETINFAVTGTITLTVS
jgi:hypothetical protein